MRFLAVMALTVACADLTAPSSTSAAGTSAAVRAAAAPAPAPTPAPRPEQIQVQPLPGNPPAQNMMDRITASHILVAFKGAQRAAPTVTRSKEEAKKRAEQLLARLQQGANFAAVASAESDDPTAKEHGGNLGTFDRFSMTKPFADAAFALQPNQLSAVVETDFGYHIVKRTQ